MPMMSLEVVMKGPVANAGSMFMRFIRIGMVEPTKAAKQTTSRSAVPLVRAMLRFWLRYQVIPTNTIEQMKPFKNPTRSSFESLTIRSDVWIAPVASPLTTIDEDWMPMLPPRAATNE